jgi:amidophosphoribosyltransferase
MCGIVGVYGDKAAAYLAYLGLHAVQHRGQESAGIVSSDGTHLHSRIKERKVADVFRMDEKLEDLIGSAAIGHVRYSTTGGTSPKNMQPIVLSLRGEEIALAHNGNLTNYDTLKNRLEEEGAIFSTATDTELIFHLMSRSRSDSIEGKLSEALIQVEGSYSLVLLAKNKLIAAKDPYGWRPLSIGRENGAYMVASEPVAFGKADGAHIREVQPGEMVIFDEKGMRSQIYSKVNTHAFCIFELIYFAGVAGRIFGFEKSVQSFRLEFGRQLAREHPAEADFVMPVPDSGNPGALGYSLESGIPFMQGLIRSHYIDRTFIEPRKEIRGIKNVLKFDVDPDVVEGKRLIVVDDSIVRSNSSREIVGMLLKNGAKEVHVRIHSPPIIAPCFFGIDTPKYDELAASSRNTQEICDLIGATTLGYLSLQGLLSCVKETKEQFCTGCFTDNYPIKVTDSTKKTHQKK